MNNWKTTANGVLAFLIATLTTILTFQVPTALLNPAQSHTWLYITVGCNLSLAMCRAWIGLIQHDASESK